MVKYLLRLDDAAEKMNLIKWNQMEQLLDSYDVRPLVGVIPNCKDPMMDVYAFDCTFWDRVQKWREKGWCIALHGYEHVYCSKDGGLNPRHHRSEFAGLPLPEQERKIRSGVDIFRQHGINPKVFFAPSHTFDYNTIIALKKQSDIKMISDTFALSPYTQDDMVFIPQQSGKVRRLPFSLTTFCYHPNTMNDEAFDVLKHFIMRHRSQFISLDESFTTSRKKNVADVLLQKLYFALSRGD